jgi:soluble lytic murein transglycosylase
LQSGTGRRLSLLLLAACSVSMASLPVTASGLDSQREAYSAAIKAIEHGHWTDYRRLRSELDDYPLAIYLDYFHLVGRDDNLQPTEAAEFLVRSDDSPLANRLLGHYLKQVGSTQRWQDFLHAKPDEPNSPELKCYFFRAQLAQGDREVAWRGAEQLWVQGTSQPAACDPLFDAWQAQGGLTDALVWTRLLNTFDARQPSLLQFVANAGSDTMRPWAARLIKVYAEPDALLTLSLPADSFYSADIASRGLVLLAARSPATALTYWHDLRRRLHFSDAQKRQVEAAITLEYLLDRDQALVDWLDDALARLRDDKLTGVRLRRALRDWDWVAFERTLPLLSESARDEHVWRYWEAVAFEHRGDTAAAKAALGVLATERDYYGFLAADRLGRPYAFNRQRLTLSDASPMVNIPAVQRITELTFHGEQRLAQSEWHKLLQDTSDRTHQQDLALLASRNGWHRMAIDAATRAEAWDALDERFPTPYADVFSRYSASWNVPRTELLAIARRESAFYPLAESPVGARGLMQVMPDTGAVVAASLRLPHRVADLFDVVHNVALGSAYYRQLLDRFGGNRLYALAAYNAGPHRVDRWRDAAGQRVAADLWIELIPFLETRNYVQAVLAYNVVFQYLAGEPQYLLTSRERQSSY